MIERVSWSNDSAMALFDAARGDLDLIAAEVKSGNAQLFTVSGNASGYIVVRPEGDELVIVAGSGRGLIPVVLPLLKDEAEKQGFKTIRTHVQKQGLIRLYKRYGFELDEFILRCQCGR